MFEHNDYKVTYGMNVTDVGHLTSDADEGEDKIERQAQKEGKNPLEIARHYEELFWSDLVLFYVCHYIRIFVADMAGVLEFVVGYAFS